MGSGTRTFVSQYHDLPAMEEAPDAADAGAIEAVAYLARSDNRAAVLAHLAEERLEPSDLVDVTGASRPTVGRILGELQDRKWVDRTGGGYVATPAGRAVVSEFEPFVGALEAIQRLGDAVAWLPRDDHPIDLRHFRHATVRAPGQDDPVKALDFVTELLEDATTWRVLTHLMAPARKRSAMLEGVSSGRLDAVTVLSVEVVDRLLTDPERRTWLRNYVDAGATVGRYDEPIPCNLFVVDDLVLIGESHPAEPYTAIASDDDVVRTWAVDLIDSYLADSNPITSAVLDDEPPT